MTNAERFNYSGPATIDGVTFPEVLLMEQPPEEGQRSWTGSTSYSAGNPPEGFLPTLGGASGAVPLVLPDGRSARVIIDNIEWDGRDHHTVTLVGVGPAPGMGT